MLVVADSSPLNALVRVQQVNILPVLFTSVTIPPEVQAELSDPRAPDIVRQFIALPPAWLHVRSPVRVERIPPLDRGEEAAINLAREMAADAILIDERDGRREAIARGIAVIGTLGVLDAAAERGMVDLPATLEHLRESGFRLAPSLIQTILHRHRGRSASG
jgi:predicted nucleic acid-binding protein